MDGGYKSYGTLTDKMLFMYSQINVMLHMYIMTIWTHTDCRDRCNSNHCLTGVYKGVLGMVLLV